MSPSWSVKLLAAGLGLAMIASTLLEPLAATAQSGPQFGNWGPGKPAPDQEGVDSSAAGGSGAPNAAAPYGAAAPDAAVAPGLVIRGCPYDLRGIWRNDGYQNAVGYSAPARSYSTNVSVRQFRSWVQAQQEDGISYYGQCQGNRLLFDMYLGYQYVGRQEGMIYGNTWFAPGPLYDDVTPPAASAAPAPGYVARPALWIGFSWTSTYGSGTETWTLTTAAFPGPINPGPILYPPPLPTVATPTPTATLTPSPTPPLAPPTPTVAPTPAAGVPRIDALQPARGPAGTEVLVRGSGFAPDDNLVLFGPSLGLHHPDGTPANLVARSGSPDGTTLRFTVPDHGPSGVLCDDSGHCIGIAAILPQPGSYEVTVSNANGASNVARFELIGEGIARPSEPPTAGDEPAAEAEEPPAASEPPASGDGQ